jgi:predicted nucleic acid-binding protein
VIVVCDTSPLNYLVLVGSVDALPKLFKDVYVPPTVLGELLHDRTPESVRQWVRSPPPWLKVVSPTTAVEAPGGLGPGEVQAVALAKEIHANLLLMDERDGTRFARQQGLRVVGTLAVLEQAASRGLLDFPAVLERLQRTSFRVSSALVRAALERDAGRRTGRG